MWSDAPAAVEGDPELKRILELEPEAPVTRELVEALSQHLRQPGADCTLFEKQAAVLRAGYLLGGCFASMPTGEGKTLCTLLLPRILGLDARESVLMVPANLFDKTTTEFCEYLAAGWKVILPTLVGYEEMGRLDRETKLSGDELSINPKLLMLDEADEVRNLGSSRGRKIRRCVRTVQPRPRVVVLSGTLIDESLMSYWELLTMALREHAPAPLDRDTAERWAEATDREIKSSLRGVPPGALTSIPGGFHAWLRSRGGVVSGRGSDCPQPIHASIWHPTLPPELLALIERTRVSYKRPDGVDLNELELPEVLCQLALGLFLIWDPMPPRWWSAPRSDWWGYSRGVLDLELDGFDSEEPIWRALDRGTGLQPPNAEEGRRMLAAWRAVKDRFVPNPVPVWLTHDVIDQLAVRARAPGTITWVKNRAVGEALRERGLPYYGADTRPDRSPPGEPIVCSLKAHARGKNFQHGWWRSILTHPMASARRTEQWIARTHRIGQPRPVELELIGAIDYHGEVLERVIEQARAAGFANGDTQKICKAQWH